MNQEARYSLVLLARCVFWSGLVAAALIVSPGSTSEAADTGGVDGMDVEAGVCADCHEEAVTTAHRGPHAVLDRDPGLAARHEVTSSCDGCHGDSTAHLETGDVDALFSFSTDRTATERSARCLSCHATDQPRFHATSHAQMGLDCTSCHRVHAEDAGPAMLAFDTSQPLLDLDPASTTCSSCHARALADFEFNERHRLQEGILGCQDCHDPHAPSNRRLLGGFKQQQCAQCHADKSGPFVFEHGSVMVDGCVSCHEPHGGPNRHQLTFQRVADLCYSCHIAVPGFHARFTNETVCTNCHSTIHGSNFHPAFLQ